MTTWTHNGGPKKAVPFRKIESMGTQFRTFDFKKKKRKRKKTKGKKTKGKKKKKKKKKEEEEEEEEEEAARRTPLNEGGDLNFRHTTHYAVPMSKVKKALQEK